VRGAPLAVFAALLGGALLHASAARAACMGRPTDASGYQGYAYGAAEVKSFAKERVRVHWATSGTHAPALASGRADGVPDSVAYAADVAEQALARYAEMGYRAVPSDTACASNGGDEKLDVYLVRFNGGDGACVAECTGGACPSFALVDAKLNGGYASPEEGFRMVVTHELFHAVQNLYKTGDDPFWAEGTAQWAMKTLHPDLPDFERNLPKFFGEPTRSLDAPPTGVTAGYLYGSAVWPLFLATSFGPDTVREIFEVEAEGHEALEATDLVLAKKGSSLAEAFPMFAAWNVATAELAGTGGYPDAAQYPGVKTAALEDGASNITSGLAYFAYRGALDAKYRIELETDAARNGGLVVPIEGGKARIDRAAKLPAEAEGEVVVVVAGTTTRKTDAPFAIRLAEPEAAPPAASSSGGAPGGGDDGCRAAPGPSPSGGGLLLAGVGAVLAIALRSPRRRRA